MKMTSSNSSSSILTNPVVGCILITETAERVAYFGFRAILVLYFVHGLQYEESTAVSLCSATQALAFLSPLLGALLADGSWGRYLTILRFGAMYAVGLILLASAAYQVVDTSSDGASDPEFEFDEGGVQGQPSESESDLTMQRGLTFLGLFFTCMGTGGIKPCVSAFGADQVVLEDEAEAKKSEGNENENTGHLRGPETFFQDEPDTASTAQEYHLKQSPVDKNEQQSLISTLREERIREFFNSFYFCINVGAVGSFAVIPVVRSHFGFGEAFLIPALFMLFALALFWSQRKRYRHNTGDSNECDSSSLTETFSASAAIVLERLRRMPVLRQLMAYLGIRHFLGDHALVSTAPEEDDGEYEDRFSNERTSSTSLDDPANQKRQHAITQDAAQALHVLPILFMFPIFWMLYDQQGSVWTLQASRMALHGLQPEQLNVLNPIQIMIFIPLFDKIVYPKLEAKGYNLRPLVRIQYGMVLASLSFLTSAILEYYMENHPTGTVHVAWQVPQITILTVAEILLSVTGLEFAYAQSPPNTKALILALYFFMMAIGDGFGAILYASVFSTWRLASAMLTCSILMIINFMAFALVARRWRPYVRNNSGPFDSDPTLELQSMIEQH